MKSTITLLATTVPLFTGCRDESKLNGTQPNYDVMQEGAASGVAATIGEATPPMIATNVDTTTAFQLPVGATETTATPPDTIAGTMAAPVGAPNGILVAQPSATRRPEVTPRTAGPAPSSARPSETSPAAGSTVAGPSEAEANSPSEPVEEPVESEEIGGRNDGNPTAAILE